MQQWTCWLILAIYSTYIHTTYFFVVFHCIGRKKTRSHSDLRYSPQTLPLYKGISWTLHNTATSRLAPRILVQNYGLGQGYRQIDIGMYWLERLVIHLTRIHSYLASTRCVFILYIYMPLILLWFFLTKKKKHTLQSDNHYWKSRGEMKRSFWWITSK